MLSPPTATVDGKQVFKWNPGETVTAAAYDNPIPGFGTRNCINLRLWAARPSKEFDLEAFNTGAYVQCGVVCTLQSRRGATPSWARGGLWARHGIDTVSPHTPLHFRGLRRCDLVQAEG